MMSDDTFNIQCFCDHFNVNASDKVIWDENDVCQAAEDSWITDMLGSEDEIVKEYAEN